MRSPKLNPLAPQQHYFKAHAYRIKPLSTKGCLSVDGEAFPFGEFQVEVHRGLGTLLSPYGHYAVNFQPRVVGRKDVAVR
jgi:sphingosine kinase